MLRRRPLILLSLACALEPSPVAAGISAIDVGVQCTSDAFQACVSSHVWVGTNTYGGTSLYVNISNLQGSPAFEHLRPAGLLTFYVGGLSVTGCEIWHDYGCDTQHEMESRLGDAGSGSEEDVFYRRLNGVSPGTYEPSFLSDDGEQHFRLDDSKAAVGFTFGDGDDFYYGCDFDQVDQGAFGFTLCGGSFDFDFNLGPGVHLGLTNRTYLELTFWRYDGGILLARCSTSRSAADRCVRVPEPGTWLMTVTGILALGCVGRRRWWV